MVLIYCTGCKEKVKITMPEKTKVVIYKRNNKTMNTLKSVCCECDRKLSLIISKCDVEKYTEQYGKSSPKTCKSRKTRKSCRRSRKSCK